ncbi:MAG: O-antigen ligase domain-containing protein, partial [Hymenobacter sp.]
MWLLFSETNTRRLSLFFGIVIIVGIFLSFAVRVLPSIGIAGLFLTGVGYSVRHRRIAQRAQWPALLSFTGIYLLHAITGLAHYDTSAGTLQEDLVLQLPFLLLPLSFLLLPTWPEVHRTTLWLVLIGCCVVSALGATINYVANYEVINQAYLRSQVIPTAQDHIRLSLLISMAVLVGAVLLFTKALPPLLRNPTAAGIMLLFVFQHLFAVRSGLLTMYAGGVILLIWLATQREHRKAVLFVTVLLAALAGACLHFFPTLQNRIANTRYDAGLVELTDAANNYSITARIYSYKVAWAIIHEHPLLGVSKVKLNEEIASQYSYMYPEIEEAHYLMPHNQFLYNLAAYGVIGLLVFILCFY